MRTTRMIGVLLLLAMGNWPTRGLAFVDTTASWRFRGSAYALHNPSTGAVNGQVFDDGFTSMTLADVHKPIFLTGTSSALKGFAYVTGELQASAGIGNLHASVDLDLYASNEIAGFAPEGIAGADVGEANVTASWRDSATITVPGLPQGFPLLVPAGINVDGFVNAAFSAPVTNCCGSGLLTVQVRSIDGTLSESGLSRHSVPAEVGDRDEVLADGFHYALLHFENGVPHDIGFTLEVLASGHANRNHQLSPGPVEGSLLALYRNSVTWGGISGVMNAETGDPVENWTIASESGFDYSRPYGVPEPASLLLIGLALCCSIGLQARR